MLFNNFFLIDDDTTSNFLNENLIKNIGLVKSIKTFNYANIALNELKQSIENSIDFPDIILLDINMPYMNGWEFLEEFQQFPKEILSKCKLFMFSSSVDINDVEKSKTYNVVSGFIHKPLTIPKLHSLK
jgi:response regulator of citrate/malate metabolism